MIFFTLLDPSPYYANLALAMILVAVKADT
jgi:hypothetical protein